MGKRTIYSMAVLLALAVGTTVQAEVFVDDFNTPHDYVVDGVEGTLWDDYIGWMSGETVDALNASMSRDGQLYIASTNGVWDSPWNPLGPFLYKVVKGDFIVSVKVTDYAGTSAAPVLHNDGGLMARAFLSDAGAGEDWISIDYFPIWSCGNFLWQADNNVRNEAWGCNNGKQWNLDPWLQLERSGNVFHVRTSKDGVTWTEMSCSPKTRSDFEGLPLMVGLRHATYSGTQGYVAFDDFRLETIIRYKAHDPSPADKASNVVVSKLAWTRGDFAARHDVYLGTSLVDVQNATTSTADIYKGRQDSSGYPVSNLEPGTTYYWRIDEVNDAHPDKLWKGDVWSFTPVPLTAWNPRPEDGAQCVVSTTDLIWSAGPTALKHEVYFGTDQTAVTNATRTTPLSVYKASQTGTTYHPGTLAKDTTYYWRVDELEKNGTTRYKGAVWSFHTLPNIPVFDSHLVGWWKLDGGCANNDIVVDSSGYNRHGTVYGNADWIPGYDGYALDLDGRGTYVELPIGDLIGSLTNSSFMTWANFSNSGGAWQRIFDFGNDPNVHMFLTPRIFYINPMRFAITKTGGGYGIGADGECTDDTATLPSGWHHVAVTIDATTGTVVLYLDGEEQKRNTASILTPKDLGKTTHNWLGRSQYTDDAYYLGSLDDFRIYDYAVARGEVVRAMAGDPLLAWNPKPSKGSVPDVVHASPLTWSPGTGASRHDVYFGTDANDVNDADRSDTTGIYRGLFDANSYTLPETLDRSRTYYWRIDEQGTGAALYKGRVWSFTTADYLVVDDFESYDDMCNRIFFSWVDGMGYSVSAGCNVAASNGNGTGSTVGNSSAPFAEQTIVHSGGQAMPFWYDNTKAPLYSETVHEWDTAQSWTNRGVNTLTVFLRGNPAAFVEVSAGTIVMNGTGTDIWGTTDEFRFACKSLKGNGSIIARVDAVANTNASAKAGVMIRETLDAGSKHAMVIVTPSRGISFQRRTDGGGTSSSTDVGGLKAPYWVKLTRSGSTFTAQQSADGVTWADIAVSPAVTITMANDVYIGLAVTSHAAGVVCGAKFSKVSTSGTVTGSWQTVDMGVTQVSGNALDTFYAVVQDASGKSTVVTDPDPSAVATGNWEQWDIPLSQLTSAGVNVTAIKKLTLGVGDRSSPKAGGTGKLYIDDVRLYVR